MGIFKRQSKPSSAPSTNPATRKLGAGWKLLKATAALAGVLGLGHGGYTLTHIPTHEEVVNSAKEKAGIGGDPLNASIQSDTLFDKFDALSPTQRADFYELCQKTKVPAYFLQGDRVNNKDLHHIAETYFLPYAESVTDQEEIMAIRELIIVLGGNGIVWIAAIAKTDQKNKHAQQDENEALKNTKEEKIRSIEEDYQQKRDEAKRLVDTWKEGIRETYHIPETGPGDDSLLQTIYNEIVKVDAVAESYYTYLAAEKASKVETITRVIEATTGDDRLNRIQKVSHTFRPFSSDTLDQATKRIRTIGSTIEQALEQARLDQVAAEAERSIQEEVKNRYLKNYLLLSEDQKNIVKSMLLHMQTGECTDPAIAKMTEDDDQKIKELEKGKKICDTLAAQDMIKKGKLNINQDTMSNYRDSIQTILDQMNTLGIDTQDIDTTTLDQSIQQVEEKKREKEGLQQNTTTNMGKLEAINFNYQLLNKQTELQQHIDTAIATFKTDIQSLYTMVQRKLTDRSKSIATEIAQLRKSSEELKEKKQRMKEWRKKRGSDPATFFDGLYHGVVMDITESQKSRENKIDAINEERNKIHDLLNDKTKNTTQNAIQKLQNQLANLDKQINQLSKEGETERQLFEGSKDQREALILFGSGLRATMQYINRNDYKGGYSDHEIESLFNDQMSQLIRNTIPSNP